MWGQGKILVVGLGHDVCGGGPYFQAIGVFEV